ncbi:hypothetical protein EON67_01750 [archaeon]|nr:MAG: hypothetical protein EON67_01750 [archaeon]
MQRIEPLYLADDAGFPLECFDIPPQYKVRGAPRALRPHTAAPRSSGRGSTRTRARGRAHARNIVCVPYLLACRACLSACMQPYVSKVLLSHGLILDRVAKLARDISAAYAGRTPHLLVVLKASRAHVRAPTRARARVCVCVPMHGPRSRPREMRVRLVGRMQGGYEFATDLMRFMKNEHSYDTKPHLPFTVDFVRVKSYEGTESTGKGMCRRDVRALHPAACLPRAACRALLCVLQSASLAST